MIRVRYRQPGHEPYDFGVVYLPREAERVLMHGREFNGYGGYGYDDNPSVPVVSTSIRTLRRVQSLNFVRTD